MVTIEVLRDIGFFDKIPALKNLCLTHRLKELYVTPTICLGNNQCDFYLALEENDVETKRPINSFLSALTEIRKILEPLFKAHHLKLKVFPIDTLELVEDDSDYYPIYQTALKSAIPIRLLNQELPLKMQWDIQSLSAAFNAKQKPQDKVENTSAIMLSNIDNNIYDCEYFADEDSEPETDTAQKRPTKKRKLGD